MAANTLSLDLKMWILLLLTAFTIGASAQLLNPKCSVIKNETQQADIRRPEDGISNPECETDGKFKNKQCYKEDECCCVNSAGLCRTGKGDKNLTCEELVETQIVRLVLTHRPVAGGLNAKKTEVDLEAAFHQRYNNLHMDIDKIVQVKYYPEDRQIQVDVQKPEGDSNTDVASLAYHIQRDLMPLSNNQEKFELRVDSIKLELEKIQEFYTDEKPPDSPTKGPSAHAITIIVVVGLIFTGAVAFGIYAGVKRWQKKKEERGPL
ncbi:epithelial cell adhesion molecule isoform X2 [Xyrichtys novacula]|uniref:Epithelial cell adhesion molecule isoform X2 n=1 Tax=Xyrichtys novacula TaxID=13765 RepID=A0AAV1G079_XYRNO|nr:epithelial cell adhesion molecule isoform X2 [Xyrichtys novacula]